MKSLNLRMFMPLAVLSLLASACSKDKHYTINNPVSGQSLYNYAAIPSGVWLNGVNAVDFYSTADGLAIQADDTSSQTVTAGGFNGGGLGNKAYVGLNQFAGMPVSSIQSFEIEARLDRGSSYNYINLQVDCDGDGNWVAGTDAIVTADNTAVPGLMLGASFSRVVISASDPVFKSVGAVCGLPSHGGIVGLPLSALPPTARLFNGATTDGGMPRSTSMASVLFLMGDSTTRTARQVTLREFKVNAVSYRFVDTH